MSYPIKYPTPQGANIQIFNVRDAANNGIVGWTKPQGASFVWFTLIGGGGGSDTAATTLVGGGSGVVTNFMGPAFLMPDFLEITVGGGGVGGADGTASNVYYVNRGGSTYFSLLLQANGGRSGNSGGAGGTAMTANYFTAMGFFQSVAGQAGINGNQSASATTFLSGGSYNGSVTGNYGYTNAGNGFFQTQPIIVGTGGGVTTSGKGGIGCGGGGTSSARSGGDGMVVIITW